MLQKTFISASSLGWVVAPNKGIDFRYTVVVQCFSACCRLRSIVTPWTFALLILVNLKEMHMIVGDPVLHGHMCPHLLFYVHTVQVMIVPWGQHFTYENVVDSCKAFDIPFFWWEQMGTIVGEGTCMLVTSIKQTTLMPSPLVTKLMPCKHCMNMYTQHKITVCCTIHC